MKSSTALVKITEPEYLRGAWKKLTKRKKSKGCDGVTIESFASDLDWNLRQIRDELRNGTYSLKRLRPSVHFRPGSPKPRPLQIPAVRDRVVMKALAIFIGPTFKKFDLPCSFAYIKGDDRGVPAVIRKVHELVDEGFVHYFEADIVNFFGTVDRSRLWTRFAKQVRHRSILPILKQCFEQELSHLESFQLEYEKLFVGVTAGIPQGGVLSPMLANFYLYEFDRKVIAKGFKLIRYADDFVVMCKTREEAERAHELCRSLLEQLGLRIHSLGEPNSKSRFGYFRKEGLNFVGVRFEGKVTSPDPKAIRRFRDKVTLVLKPHTGDNLAKTLQGLKNLIQGWGNGYKAMRVQRIYLELDEHIRQEMSRYLQASGIKLENRDRRKQMRFLGIPSLSAMLEHMTK